jgi:hypothetical protein
VLPLSAVAASALIATPAEPAAVRRAVERAVPLIAAAAAGHAERKSCFGCHNQAMAAVALPAARAAGVPVEADLLAEQAEHVAAFLQTNREAFLVGKGTGGQADTAGYALFTLDRLGHPPDDEATAAVVEYLLKYQADRDHYRCTSNRPPSEASDFTTTYLAVRGLNRWATGEQKERAAKRVERVRRWLLAAPAKETEDRVFRLLALHEAGADAAAVRLAADELASLQRPDGGWGQRPAMASDAYATGSALFALVETGSWRTDDPRYRVGCGFLVRTQRPDGTWFVKSRSKPFQPYYESGFPHGKDQFISAAASGWATAALAGGLR